MKSLVHDEEKVNELERSLAPHTLLVYVAARCVPIEERRTEWKEKKNTRQMKWKRAMRRREENQHFYYEYTLFFAMVYGVFGINIHLR